MADAYPLKLVDNGDGTGKLVQFVSGDTVPRDNLPVQSSTWDTTAGALLQVGAFGTNGGPARIMPSSTDANTLTTSGMYVFPDGGTNMPTYVYSYLEVITHRDTSFVKQIAHGMNNNQMFTRQRFDGTWGVWTRVYTADTVVGTVSQASGVSTGAIIERGSNANGSYTRFADGTQICLVSFLTNGTTTYSVGTSLWGSDAFGYVWPASFASLPGVTASCYRSDGGAAPAVFPTCFTAWGAAHTGQWRSITAENSSIATIINLIAIGRWF